MQKEKKYSKKSYFIIHSAVLAVLLVIMILAQTLTTKWDSALTDFFGTVGGTKLEAQSGDFVSRYVYVKHFALNDQETNRAANNQVSVWSEEQAIREIYLKPFQMAVEDGGAKGIMLSMNRIGSTWTGNHYPLMTTVARGEWGFEGIYLTDYLGSLDSVMSDKYLAAGGNLILATTELKLTNAKENWCRAYLRDSMHRVLYVQANSLAVNGLGGEAPVEYKVGTPIYKIALWILWGLLALYAVYSIIRMIQYGRMSDKEFTDSRKRTAKARRIKNIVLAVVLAALAAYLIITYLPVLQKAFLI